MKIVKGAALAATLLGYFALGTPGQAQFGPVTPARLRIEAGRGSKRTTSLLIYPFAPFATNDAAGVFTAFGGMVAIETAVVPGANKPTATAFGAWYWAHGKADVYEFHAKHYFKDNLGVQAGLLDSTKVKARGYDAFVLYTLTPPNTDKNYWNFQVGAGLYNDPSKDAAGKSRNTTDFTGFIQGDTTLSKNWKINATYWYVGDRGRLNRFAVGLGYSF